MLISWKWIHMTKPTPLESKEESVWSAVTELRTHNGIYRIKLAVTLVSMSYFFYDLWWRGYGFSYRTVQKDQIESEERNKITQKYEYTFKAEEVFNHETKYYK